jgi:hypothetical protein
VFVYNYNATEGAENQLLRHMYIYIYTINFHKGYESQPRGDTIESTEAAYCLLITKTPPSALRFSTAMYVATNGAAAQLRDDATEASAQLKMCTEQQSHRGRWGSPTEININMNFSAPRHRGHWSSNPRRSHQGDAAAK